MKTIMTAFILMVTSQVYAQTNTFPSSGNVGIGTISPQEKLSVSGNIQTAGNYPYLSFQTNHWGQDSYIQSGVNLQGNANGDYLSFQIPANRGFNFSTNGLNRLLINPNGNVGIGTTIPQRMLQLGDFQQNSDNKQILIPGTYNFEQMRLGQIGNGNMAIEFVNHQGIASSYGMKMEVNTDFAPGLNFQYAATKTSYSELQYQTGMFLARWGDVGIGTTTPKEKLSVNGKIRAHEIKVETANWPDYVFEDGYRVGTLEALESYIKVHKHLPEFPSAKEAEANGVALGEMNKLLLKKVEELTLHLIEKEKQLKKLEYRMEKLENNK